MKISASHLKPTFAGKVAYHLLPVRRKVVTDNIRLVFGDSLTEKERLGLAQNFYGHLWKLLVENLTTGFLSQDQIRQRVKVVDDYHIADGLKLKKGVLLMTGHFGNWELAPVGGMLHFPQWRGKFHVLRRAIVNKTIEKILFRRFYAAGLDIIPKKRSLDRVLDELDRNEIVTFIMDQHAKPGKDGVVVDFFGKKAGTFKSLAMVARSTGAPIVPSASYREEDGTHVMCFYPPLTWVEDDDFDKEILINTKIYNETMEKMVLEHPTQWWWVHKRWKIK